MKVYEIIAEDAKTGILTKAAGWLTNKLGGGAISKAMGKGEFIEAEANAIANLAKSHGVSVAKAMQMSRKKELDSIKYSIKLMNPRIKPAELERQAQAELLSIKPHLSDPSVLSKIERQAGTQSGINALSHVGEKLGIAGKAVDAAVHTALTAWAIYAFYKPWSEFKENMEAAQHNLSKGWTRDNYQHALNEQTTILITKWGALLAGGLIAKVFSGPLGKLIGVGLPAVGAIVSRLGPAAAYTYLSSKENSEGIAAFIANNIPEVSQYIGGLLSPFLQPLTNLADPDKAALDAPGKTGGGANASPAGTTTGGKQDIDSTSTPGKNNSASSKDAPTTSKPYITPKGRKMYSNDPLALRNYDITGWVRKPGQPGWIMNPNDKTDILQEPPGWTPD
jgi:hypothetical protein